MFAFCPLSSFCLHSKKYVKIGHNTLYNLKDFSVFIFTSILNFILHCIVLELTEMSVK